MAKAMNHKERQALSDYVREAADLMLLQDWSFTIKFVEPESLVDSNNNLAYATLEPSRHRMEAELTLPNDFRYQPDCQGKSGKQLIAHELVHVHWARNWDMVRHDLIENGSLSRQVYDLFVANYERNMEFAVDALAVVIEYQLPDIKWPKNKKKKKKGKKR